MKMILHTAQSRRDQVYKAIIGELERLEHRGTYRGNGHHLSQRLVDMLWAAFEDDLEVQYTPYNLRDTLTAIDHLHGTLNVLQAVQSTYTGNPKTHMIIDGGMKQMVDNEITHYLELIDGLVEVIHQNGDGATT